MIRLVHNCVSSRQEPGTDASDNHLQTILTHLKSGTGGRHLRTSTNCLLGKPFGPRLAFFLQDADRSVICKLLNV